MSEKKLHAIAVFLGRRVDPNSIFRKGNKKNCVDRKLWPPPPTSNGKIPILGGGTYRTGEIFGNRTVVPETANGCLVA